MIRFAYTTDWHIKSMPSSSIDIKNFTQTMLGRIKQIISSDVDFILHGGDMFDTPDIDDLSLFNDVVKLLYAHKIPIHLLPGSHDLIGYSADSLNWSCLKTLENSGLLSILQPGINRIGDIEIYAQYPSKQHSLDMYRGLKNLIVVSHNIISPVPLQFPHVITKDIAEVVEQCLFLCGDLHMPFKEFYETCAFLNPGPLLKMSLSDKAESSGFFIINFDPKTFMCEFQHMPFPDADITERESDQAIETFSNKIKIEQHFVDLADLVTKTSTEMYNDPKVTEEALRWISSKK